MHPGPTIPVASRSHRFRFLPRKVVRPRRSDPAKRKAASARIAHSSITYIVTFIAEILRTTPLDVLDVLLTLAISRASLAPPAGGISRNQLSRVLNVPLETVRRRVAVLLDKRIIRERESGLVVPDRRPLGALANHDALLARNAQALRQLILDLKAEDVRLR
jgi:hypothetical protein